MPEKKSNRGKGPSPTTKMILFGKTGGRRKKTLSEIAVVTKVYVLVEELTKYLQKKQRNILWRI